MTATALAVQRQQAAVLRAENLRCLLGGRAVVDGVTLDVRPAEVVGLLGPNGAGKTTLMRLLCGVLRPAGGRVLLDGADITAMPVHRRALLGLGYLPQEPSVFGGLTVRQNIEAVLQLRRAPRQRADELLEMFELAPLARRRAANLSGGERRRVELARLLAVEPKVVLLDEPLAGLDPLAIDELKERITILTDRGVGVLLADHNVQHALTICRRACILVDGRVIAAGPPKELIDNHDARRVFFGTAA